MTARYKCTHCGMTDAEAREFGCGAINKPRGQACPMDFRFLIDRIRYRLFGKLPK